MAIAMLAFALGVIPARAWAEPTGNGTQEAPYKVHTAADLQTALQAESTANIYVELDGSITGSCSATRTTSTKAVNLDLKGNNITSSDGTALTISGFTLTLNNSTGTGAISGKTNGVVVSSGGLTMNGGTINGGATGYGVDASATGVVFTVNAGTISGGSGAISGKVKHPGGFGWKNTQGTGDKEAIAASATGSQIDSKYKKVQLAAYAVAVTPNDSTRGTVTGANTYVIGQSATITATPKDGYVFECWTEEGSNEKITDATYTFTVDRARSFTALFWKVKIDTTIADQPYAGKPIEPPIPAADVTLEGVDLAITSDDFTVSYANNVHAGTGTATATLTFSGKCTGTASKTFTITKIPATVTAETITREYDGTALTGGYSSEDLVKGDTITSATTGGSQTDVGSCASTVADAKITNSTYGDSTNDYDITYKPGTLEVTPYSKKATVQVAGHTVTVSHDGKEHEVTGYDATPDVSFYDTANVAFAGKASAKGTEVGTYPMGLTAKDFSNKSANFADVTFQVTDGSLTIEEAKKGTLTFDLAGGTLDGKTGKVAVVANVGETIKLPGAPTRSGYTFRHWKGSEYKAGASYKVEGDHTFTAVWDKAIYTITFEANGGTGSMDKISVEAGSTATLTPNKYSRSGYTFTGWNTQKNGKGTAYKNKDKITPTGSMTLFAQWAKTATNTKKNSSGRLAGTADPTSFSASVALALTGSAALYVGRKHR